MSYFISLYASFDLVDQIRFGFLTAILLILGIFKLKAFYSQRDKSGEVKIDKFKIVYLSSNLFWVGTYITFLFLPLFCSFFLLGQEIDLLSLYNHFKINYLQFIKLCIWGTEGLIIYYLLFTNKFLITEVIKLDIFLRNMTREIADHKKRERDHKLDPIKFEDLYLFKFFKFLPLTVKEPNAPNYNGANWNDPDLYTRMHKIFKRYNPLLLFYFLFFGFIINWCFGTILTFVYANEEKYKDDLQRIKVEGPLDIDRAKYPFPINNYIWIHNFLCTREMSKLDKKYYLFIGAPFFILHLPLIILSYDLITNPYKLYFILWYLPLWIIFIIWTIPFIKRKIEGHGKISIFAQYDISYYGIQRILFNMYYIFPNDPLDFFAVIMTKEIYEKYFIKALENNLLLPGTNYNFSEKYGESTHSLLMDTTILMDKCIVFKKTTIGEKDTKWRMFPPTTNDEKDTIWQMIEAPLFSDAPYMFLERRFTIYECLGQNEEGAEVYKKSEFQIVYKDKKYYKINSDGKFN